MLKYLLKFRINMSESEFTVDVRERGEITIPKNLRKKYNLTAKSEVRLIPKVEGILIKPKIEDPVGQLKGLAKEVWPTNVSSVNLVRNLRRKAEVEATQSL